MQNCITGQREGVYRIYKSFKGKLWGGPALMRVIPQVQKILQPHSGTIL